MWQGDYPPDPAMNAAWRRLEREVFEAASAVVVTTPGAVRTYAERFPAFGADRIKLIENGYDEETFRRAEAQKAAVADGATVPARRPLRLLHSGIVYRSERDPSQLFAALADLKRQGRLAGDDLQIVFRACGDEPGYRRDVAALGIDDIVRIEPPLGYLEALQEMLAADALLILQAANCNAQVPAKLYEYLRAGRPILALTDPAGDTAATLERAQAGTIVRLDSAAAIADALPGFVEQLRKGAGRVAPPSVVARYSRESQAGEFAQLLDAIARR
jgi:glycosyltransferase involved in cell wall biosynthesis